jgi:hypothetical protein
VFTTKILALEQGCMSILDPLNPQICNLCYSDYYLDALNKCKPLNFSISRTSDKGSRTLQISYNFLKIKNLGYKIELSTSRVEISGVENGFNDTNTSEVMSIESNTSTNYTESFFNNTFLESIISEEVLNTIAYSHSVPLKITDIIGRYLII